MNSYKITGMGIDKPIVVKEHVRKGIDKRVVRPYTKNRSWQKRLKVWVWSWLRTPVIYSLGGIIFVSFMASSFFAGALWRVYNPMPVAEAETLPQVLTGASVASTTPTDTLDDQIERIGMAETRLNQFCDDDAIAHKLCPSYEKGAVLQTINKNGTIDSGKYAINSIWLSTASKLGYDVYTEQGNHDFAIWLAKTYGVKQWYSSEINWK